MSVSKRDVSSLSKSGSAKLKGDVTLSEGDNITLTQSGQNIEVAATGGSGAPDDATYIVQTANAGLSAEQALGSLATGIVKNTTTTGVLSIAVAGTDYYAPGSTDVAVADGGTGSSTAAGAATNLGLGTGDSPQFAGVNVGHASDTTITKASSGIIAVEGVAVPTISSTDTLSNKTLTAPKFADLGFIADANGNEVIVLDTVASAVNEITISNAATGGTPQIAATGGDSGANLSFLTKGNEFNFKNASTGGASRIKLYERSDNGTSSTAIVGPVSLANDETWTLPTGSDNFVGEVTTQTLTNKTISGASNTITNISPAMRTGGFYIGTIAAVTLSTTGDKSITGVGFTPKLVKFSILLGADSTNQAIFAQGAMTASAQYLNMTAASSTPATRRQSSTSNCLGYTQTGGSALLLASYVSMNADGFTINVGTATASAFAWAFEAYG